MGQGVEKNATEGAQWLQKAAEQGFARAQYDLGYLYANGEGVEKNDGQAVVWYRKAAEQGFARAQYMLGFCRLGLPWFSIRQHCISSLGLCFGLPPDASRSCPQ